MPSPSYFFEDEQKTHPECFGHFVQKISPFLLNLNQLLNPNNYPNFHQNIPIIQLWRRCLVFQSSNYKNPAPIFQPSVITWTPPFCGCSMILPLPFLCLTKRTNCGETRSFNKWHLQTRRNWDALPGRLASEWLAAWLQQWGLAGILKNGSFRTQCQCISCFVLHRFGLLKTH